MAKRTSKTRDLNVRQVSLNELSKLLNRDRNTISKWIDEYDCPVVQRANREAGLNWILDVADVVRWLENRATTLATAVVEEDLEGGQVGYDEARRREKVAQARMAEISLDERVGNVVYISDIIDIVTKEYGALRSSLQNLGGSVAPRLIGIDNPSKIQAIVDEAIIEAISEMGKSNE